MLRAAYSPPKQWSFAEAMALRLEDLVQIRKVQIPTCLMIASKYIANKQIAHIDCSENLWVYRLRFFSNNYQLLLRPSNKC